MMKKCNTDVILKKCIMIMNTSFDTYSFIQNIETSTNVYINQWVLFYEENKNSIIDIFNSIEDFDHSYEQLLLYFNEHKIIENQPKLTFNSFCFYAFDYLPTLKLIYPFVKYSNEYRVN